jgi:hypothetical protein
VIAGPAEGRPADDIRALARQLGNYRIPIAERPLSDYAYWHRQTLDLNNEYINAPRNWLPIGIADKLVYPVLVAIITAAVLAWHKLSK